MTIQDISSILHTSWGLVKDIDKVSLGRRYKSIDIKEVRHIAIDEFSVKRGHKYMTVVMDLETRRIIYVNQGRTIESLMPLFKRFKRLGTTPKAIAMDMWPAYISAVTDYFPGTPIVFDRFHIEGNLNNN